MWVPECDCFPPESISSRMYQGQRCRQFDLLSLNRVCLRPQWQSTWAQGGDVNNTQKNPDISKCVLSEKKKYNYVEGPAAIMPDVWLSNWLQPQGSWHCRVWWKSCTEVKIQCVYFRWRQKTVKWFTYISQGHGNICFVPFRKRLRGRKDKNTNQTGEMCELGVKTESSRGAVTTYCETWCEYNSIMSLFLFLSLLSDVAPLPLFLSHSPVLTPSIFLDHQLAKYSGPHSSLSSIGNGDNCLICYNCSAVPCLVWLIAFEIHLVLELCHSCSGGTTLSKWNWLWKQTEPQPGPVEWPCVFHFS